jgi:copper(I)-binding protein
VGRALQKSSAPRRLAVVAALATGLGLAAAGCSAGQVTQTDTQVAVVNGASGQAGDIAVRDAQLLFPVAHGAYEERDDAPVVVVIANNGTAADQLLAVTSEFAEPAEITGDVELESASAVVGGGDQDDAGSHPTTTSRPSASSSASATTTTTPSGSETTTTGSGSATTTTGSAATTTTAGDDTSISNPPTSGTKTPSSADPSEPGVVKIVLKNLKKPLRPGQTIKVTFLFRNAGEVTLDLPIGASPEPRVDAPAEH